MTLHQNEMRDLLDAGACAFVPKPYVAETILQSVKEALANS